MSTKDPLPNAPATERRRLGLYSIPAAFLCLFLYKYGGDVMRWAFSPSSSSLPNSISIELVEGKYEAGTQRSTLGGFEPYANLSFNVVVDNHGCQSCSLSTVTVTLAESPGKAPFRVIRRPLGPGELGVGRSVTLAVAEKDPPAVALQKIVTVELLNNTGQNSNSVLGQRVIRIPGLGNVDEIWRQTMFSVGQATVRIPDQ
jgi:hypothetical protein